MTEKEISTTYYSLLVVDEHKTLNTIAPNRDEALSIFGKVLGKNLTIKDGDGAVPVPCLLDEWKTNPHWVDPSIGVVVNPPSESSQ